MMLIKAHDGEGNWHLYEAHWDLTFSGPSVLVEVPVRDDGKNGPEADLGYDANDGRLPAAEYTHALVGPIRDGSTFTLVRWVRWLDEYDESHRLVTSHEVFVCNSEGQTVEALR